MSGFSFNRECFTIDGEERFLLSGEFHYFRVPAEDWERRMRLFVEAGGNCIATYVPWIVHEPEEGNIIFGDQPNRDPAAFLRTAAKVGLKVILRPGPYQYSELVNSGLPEWLCDNYPEICATDVNGKILGNETVSYLHPVFLEKARRYFRAFADVARPFMAAAGGPVCMLQTDNELTGVQVWKGSIDYNAVTMGFGREDGRYPVWLKAKYGSIDKLNEAYGTEYEDFVSVMPEKQTDRKDVRSVRRLRDYYEFYRGTVAEYCVLLKDWLNEDGLGGYICHNSANPGMNAMFGETVRRMGKGFLLGSDHYYALNQSWDQNAPSPKYALSVLMSCEELRAMGMPPCVMELPGGSMSDNPPILSEDLYACYMTNLALGMKGANIYIYTGGPNFGNTGSTCEVYDYDAPVHADGSLNKTYDALRKFGLFAKENSWLQTAKRVSSVQVGFEWEMLKCKDYDLQGVRYGSREASEFIEYGILYTMMCSSYAPEFVPLDGALDISKPLIVTCASRMSAETQHAVAEFIEKGGKALILPVLPEYDLEGRSCTVLKDFIGDFKCVYDPACGTYLRAEGTGENIYGLTEKAAFEDHGGITVARDAKTGSTIGFEKEIGNGKVIVLGASWILSRFAQAKMMEGFMARLGGVPCVESSNRNIFTSLHAGGNGRRMLFMMNLFSGRQTTEISLPATGEKLGSFELGPMDVLTVEI